METVTLHVTEAEAGDKMKLTELVKLEPENIDKCVYGIVVDEYCATRQFGLEEIGLIVESDEYGAINEDVVDIATDYVDGGCRVILEVPFECNVKTSYMYMIANNIGATISLLPPIMPSNDEVNTYSDRLCDFAKEWLRDGQSHLMLEPVSGYFQYLINRAYGYKPEFISIDEYMKSEFVETMTLNDMDIVKDNLKAVIFDEFGGEDAFKEWAHSLGKAVHNEILALTN